MTQKRIFSYDGQFVNKSSLLAIEATIERGAALYDRRRHLPALIRLAPGPPGPGSSMADGRHVLRALAQALRAQRSLGRSGHWTYDLNRHIALRQAFMAEARNLRAMLGSGRAEN